MERAGSAYTNKKLKIMNKNKNFFAVALVLATSFIASPLKAQVTIGAQVPPHSTLEVVKVPAGNTTPDGIMAPQISGADLKTADAKYGTAENSALVYALSASPDAGVAGAKTANVTKAGYYYYDGANNVWVAVGGGSAAADASWFYMPSFNLPVTAVGTGLTYNLYDEYQRQFTKSGNTQFVSSNAAAATATEQPTVYTATQLDYFVTSYPTDVIKINSISSTGIMNYDVLTTNIPEGSFINVVFKVK